MTVVLYSLYFFSLEHPHVTHDLPVDPSVIRRICDCDMSIISPNGHFHSV